MKKILNLILILLFPALLWAQDVVVTGTVTDASTGEQLPGVNIIEEGTTNGVISGIDGNFKLSVSSKESFITFTSLGYKKQTVKANVSVLQVKLESELILLNEIVAVGYGSQKKANLTGAVASMKIDESVTQAVTNTSQLLQGRMSGVQLTQAGGQPGKEGVTIRIRGIGTSGNSDPIVIVDGMERPLADVAPSDIESISVLKDAASAAIYGSRAANGVILITTKSGQSGGMKIQYDSYYGWQSPTVLPDLMDAPTYAKMINEATGQERYSDDDIQKIIDGSDPDRFANTNWSDELFRTSPIVNHYLAFSGGSDKTTYRVSSNFMDQEGTMLNSEYQRYNLRVKVDSQVKDWLKIGANVDGSIKNITEPSKGVSSLIQSTFTNTPVAPVKYTSGDWAVQDGSEAHYIQNLVFQSQLGENKTDQYRFNFKAYASFDIIEGLKFQTNFGYNFFTSLISKFTPSFVLKEADGQVAIQNDVTTLRNTNSLSNKILNENLLTYAKKFNKHSLNLLLGHSIQDFRVDNFWAQGGGFPSNNITELGAASTDFLVSGSASELSLQSFFGRINYNYDEKYLFELNVRRDGSSRFPDNEKYGTFPSLSAAWRVNQESFFEPLKKLISNLKLRASWGQLGNQEINGYYPHAQVYALGQDYILESEKLTGGAAITSLANPNLVWETVESYNFAVDLGFLNKLNLSLDYFNKTTKDLLLKLPIPQTLGNVAAPYRNAGEVLNKGVEISLDYNDKIGDFNYYASFNLTKLHNEWIDLKGIESYPSKRIQREGETLFSYYGLEAIGIFQTDKEVSESPTQSKATAPGDIIYKDQLTIDTDGDGVPDKADGKITDDDRVVIGNPIPEFTYGFSGGFEYKGIDFSFIFQGVENVDRYVSQYGNHPGLNDRNNWTVDWKNRWTKENPSTTMPRLGVNTDNQKVSSFYIWDASYLRLKNIELGYSLPKNITTNFGIDKFRMYVSGANLITWTDFKHFDPERSIGNATNLNYPLSKTITVGVNLTF